MRGEVGSQFGYRTNPKDSRKPNFCIGCFELIISKIFATASKMGKKYLIFLRFFLRNPFLRRALRQKLFFFAFVFAFWGLVLIHFVATARDRAYLGLWDCSPFLHRHKNVDQLDSGIAVHGTDKHHPGCPVTWSLIHHSLKAKQGAKWGMRHGRGGQQAVGKTLPRFWHSCRKGGRGKKYFLRFFCRTHFCVRHDAKN